MCCDRHQTERRRKHCSVHKLFWLLRLPRVSRGARPSGGGLGLCLLICAVPPLCLLICAVHVGTCFLNSALGQAHGTNLPSSPCCPCLQALKNEALSSSSSSTASYCFFVRSVNIRVVSGLGKDLFWLLWDRICFLILVHVSISP